MAAFGQYCRLPPHPCKRALPLKRCRCAFLSADPNLDYAGKSHSAALLKGIYVVKAAQYKFVQPRFGQLTLTKVCPVCGKRFPASSLACDVDQSPLHVQETDPLLGSVIGGRYRLLSILGTGGWGRVYAARHEGLNKMVAVKVMHAHLAQLPDRVGRFEQEAQAACELRHPNVAAVYDFGTTDSGQPFLVMDLLDGQSLENILERQNHLDWQRALGIFQQVCGALREAHDKGIIHRDLKPGNIILSTAKTGETARLVDFGLAKLTGEDGRSLAQLTQTGETLGTPVYMAPEQCRGEKVDARADIYSLGCVMYECLTGVVPFAGATLFECMSKQVKYTPAPFGHAAPAIKVPALLEEIVFKCLEKDPNKRYHNASQLLADLDRAGTVQPLHTSLSAPTAAFKRPWRMILHNMQGHKRAIIFGGIACGILAATAWLAYQEALRNDPERLSPPERWKFYMRSMVKHMDEGAYDQALKQGDKAAAVAETFPTPDRLIVTQDNRAVIYHIEGNQAFEMTADLTSKRQSIPGSSDKQEEHIAVDQGQVKWLSSLLDDVALKSPVDKRQLEQLGKRINDLCTGGRTALAPVRELEQKNNRLLEQFLGGDNLTYGSSCDYLGLAEYNAGNYKEALEHFKLAYEIRRRRVPVNDPDLCRQLVNLGSLYSLNGDYEHARQYLEEANRRLEFLPDIESRADCMSDLASVYEKLGLRRQAYDQWLRLLTFWEKVGVYKTADFACLKVVYAGDYVLADRETERFLSQRRDRLTSQYGQDSEGVSNCNLGLAELYLIEHQFDKAQQAAWQACLARQVTTTPAATGTRKALETLSRVFMAQHQYDKAISLYKIMRAGVERNIGPIEKGIWLDTICKLAYLNHMVGQQSEEQALMGRFHEVISLMVPARNSYDCTRPIDQTFSALKPGSLFPSDYRHLIELICAQRCTTDPDFSTSYLPSARAYDALSRIYQAEGDLKQAQTCCELAVSCLKRGGNAYFWLPGRVYKQYATVLRALGKSAEATAAEAQGAKYRSELI